MSFLRHARSIGPMELVGSAASDGGGGAFPRHCCRLRGVQGAIPRTAPCLIVRDESHRLSLGGLLSSRACLRFAGWVQHAMKWSCRSRNFQRTANSVLTVCLSQGDNRTSASGTLPSQLGDAVLCSDLCRTEEAKDPWRDTTTQPLWALGLFTLLRNDTTGRTPLVTPDTYEFQYVS